MTHWALANLIETGLLWWLGGLFAVVLWRVLSGSIAVSGMLAHDEKALREGRPAPERVQLLAMFAFMVAAYVRLVLTHAQLGGAHPQLPDVSPQFIATFAASHSIYLGGKLGRHVVPKSSKRGD